MLKETTFDTGTVSINYAEGPPSGLPVVMLHGSLRRWQIFLPIMPAFMIRYHIFAPDLRGHGRSGRTPGAYLVDDFAGDIVALLHERVREPVIILGWSLGALVAMVLAATEPQLVRAIVLEDPPLAETTGRQFFPDAAHYVEYFRRIRDWMMVDGTADEKRSAFAALFPSTDAVSVRSTAKQFSQCDPEIPTRIIEQQMFAAYQLEDLLPQITCPVLLMQANPDRGGSLGHVDAQLAVSLLADCSHLYLEDASHGIHIEQPVEFSRLVINFLESL